MTILLFEGDLWRNFAPLVYSRPLFELRCGGFTLRERAEALAAQCANQSSRKERCPHVAGLCRPHLMEYYGSPGGMQSLICDSEPITLINGRVLDLSWLLDLINGPVGTVYAKEGVLVGAHLSPALASAVLYYLKDQHVAATFEELKRFCRIVEIDTPLLLYPWDLISLVGEQLVRDIPLLSARLPRYSGANEQIAVRGGEHVYVAPTARLDGPLALDARDGPVFIDEHAHIEPFSFIQGPAYIGAKTLVASARIRGETSFGPVCRVGGEIEASIIEGYSNKHHDGFLGHSWLGEWVNIGAMTTNSDLKNNYGSIRVTMEGVGQLDSGQIKLGCFLADHVKLGIGLHLNGGTVIGVGSNIFGVHAAPKTIPPFTWGGDVFREYRIDNMVKVAHTVMQRRKRELTPAYETLLRKVFDMTRHDRRTLVDEIPSEAVVRSGMSETALARAEAEAIRA